MATRIISQQKGVFVGPFDGAANNIIERADSFAGSTDLAGGRTDVRQFGSLSRLGYFYGSEIPCTVTVGYHLGDGTNEAHCGFDTSGNFIGSILLDPAGSEKTVGASSTDEGIDHADVAGGLGSVGFGNCAQSSYTATFSVGEIARAEIEFSASSMATDGGACGVDDLGVPVGTVAPVAVGTGAFTSLAIRPRDITVTISSNSEMMLDSLNMCVQSATAEVSLNRETVECLGRARPYKYVQFPVEATVTISANAQDYNTASLTDLIKTNPVGSDDNITVAINNAGDGIGFELRGASVNSESISVGLDDAETIETTFVAQIGSATDLTRGLFVIGAGGP